MTVLNTSSTTFSNPLTAELILMPIEELADASLLIRHQHERVDGMGFPDGLVGDGADG